jgi:signal transduction histidine kinase
VQATDGNGEVQITRSYEGKFVRLDVRDNGPGIEEEIMERIFEPFYSTKEKGSGLGLAISRRLIEKLGGRIKIRSAKGNGATLTILLPK